LRIADELRAIIATIAEFEPVRLLVPTSQTYDVKQDSLGPNVEIVEASVDDIWMRDIAPTFALRGEDIVAINWNFNSWGSTSDRPARPGDKLATEAAAIFQKDRISAPFVAEGGAFVTDGKGTIITTRSCLLNKNRNPDVTACQIEFGLAALGGRHVIWLEGNPREPITSGHADGYIMFGESGDCYIEDISGSDRIADMNRMQDIETLRSSTGCGRKFVEGKNRAPSATEVLGFQKRTLCSYLSERLCSERCSYRRKIW
jgi:agmatine deiminase